MQPAPTSVHSHRRPAEGARGGDGAEPGSTARLYRRERGREGHPRARPPAPPPTPLAPAPPPGRGLPPPAPPRPGSRPNRVLCAKGLGTRGPDSRPPTWTDRIERFVTCGLFPGGPCKSSGTSVPKCVLSGVGSGPPRSGERPRHVGPKPAA